MAMNLLTAKDVIEVAKSRGFQVRVKPGPPPMPVLYCPKSSDQQLASQALLAALKAWRLEIIEELGKESQP